MENTTAPQPLDTLMTRLGLTNAQLVNVSTEQLSFKMVQKGRKGRRITPNVQDKILTALLKVKPELKIRRRELFCYPVSEEAVEQINNAIDLTRKKKISYPQFVDLLFQAGIMYYAVNVAENQVMFYAPGGESHVVQGPPISQDAVKKYDEVALRSAIADAQNGSIDHPTFLKRIYDAGIPSYEVNIRERKIACKGIDQSYKEVIPVSGASSEPKPVTPKPTTPKKGGKAKAKKKAIKKHRVKKGKRRR